MKRLGLRALIDAVVVVSGDCGADAGAKVLTLVMSGLSGGGSHIDHVRCLRAGDTERVLEFKVKAALTVGSFLREFDAENVKQLGDVGQEASRRVHEHIDDNTEPVRLDVDSTIGAVLGKRNQAPRWITPQQLGYHPMVAVRCDTGEIVDDRLRPGASQPGNDEFITDAIDRLRGRGPVGAILVRTDSGFFSYDLLNILERLGVGYSITVPIYRNVLSALENIDDKDWRTIHDMGTDDLRVQVAETTLVPTTGKAGKLKNTPIRLISRRTGRVNEKQGVLFINWRYNAFVTDTKTPLMQADHVHRDHVTVELAIRNLKQYSGLAHLPSGNYQASAAWLATTALTHNVTRWIHLLGEHPTLTENDATLTENDTTLLEDDTTLLEDDTTPLENDTTGWEDDTTPLEDDTTLLEDDTTLLEDDITPLENDTTEQENNIKPSKNNSKSIECDATGPGHDATPAECDATGPDHDAASAACDATGPEREAEPAPWVTAPAKKTRKTRSRATPASIYTRFFSYARAVGQPRPAVHTTATLKLALGRSLPQHPQKSQEPSTTLLTPQHTRQQPRTPKHTLNNIPIPKNTLNHPKIALKH